MRIESMLINYTKSSKSKRMSFQMRISIIVLNFKFQQATPLQQEKKFSQVNPMPLCTVHVARSYNMTVDANSTPEDTIIAK